MAIGKQAGTVAGLVTFALWAQRHGYQVGEMHGFSKVHKVHAAHSWHYDKEGGYGKAADINVAAGGNTERHALATAVIVAEGLGLGVIYALHGTNGPAAQHTTHLHVDVGDYANLGSGKVAVRAGGDRVTAFLQAAVGFNKPDQIWGAETDRRLEAIRQYSDYKKHGLPSGPVGLQKILNVTNAGPDLVVDGKIGPKTKAAHDLAVKEIQGVLGVKKDGIWGPGTDGVYLGVRNIRKR